MCEDIQVQNDRTVRDATGKLYQYAYGENNYDATKTVPINGTPQVCDVSRLANKLNMMFEEGITLPEKKTEPEIILEPIEENKQETKEKKKLIEKIVDLVPDSVVDESWGIDVLQKKLDELELDEEEKDNYTYSAGDEDEEGNIYSGDEEEKESGEERSDSEAEDTEDDEDESSETESTIEEVEEEEYEEPEEVGYEDYE